MTEPAAEKKSFGQRFTHALTRLIGAFLTGLLLLLPVIVTFLLFDWILGYLRHAFGPESLIGFALTSGGAVIIGAPAGPMAFAAGVLVLVFVIAALGALIQTRARKSIEERFDRLIERLPLMRSIYRPIAQIVRMMGQDKESDVKAMRVVAVRMGQTDSLALLVSSEIFLIDGQERYLVLITTAPVPMGGAMLFVPPATVRDVPGLGVDDLMKFYISMGTILPDALAIKPAGQAEMGF